MRDMHYDKTLPSYVSKSYYSFIWWEYPSTIQFYGPV